MIGTSMTGRFAFFDDADIRFDVRIKRGHVFDEFAYRVQIILGQGFAADEEVE